MLKQTKKCCACANDIPDDADLCSVCNTQQTRRGRFLQRLATNLALIVAGASFAVWLITNIPKMVVVLHPVYKLQVIVADSAHEIISNIGNKPVFIEGLIYESTIPNGKRPSSPLPLKVMDGMDKVIKPGEVFNHEHKVPLFGPLSNSPGWTIVPIAYQERIGELVDAGVNHRCVAIILYSEDNIDYRMLKDTKRPSDAPITIKLTGTVTYHVLDKFSEKQTMSFPAVAIFLQDPEMETNKNCPKL